MFTPRVGETFLAKNEAFLDGWEEVRCLCVVEKERGVNAFGIVLFSWDKGRRQASCWLHENYVKEIKIEKEPKRKIVIPNDDNVKMLAEKIRGYDATKLKTHGGVAFPFCFGLWRNGFSFHEISKAINDNHIISRFVDCEATPRSVEAEICCGIRYIINREEALIKQIKKEKNEALQTALTCSGELVTIKTADCEKAKKLSEICKSIAVN